MSGTVPSNWKALQGHHQGTPRGTAFNPSAKGGAPQTAITSLSPLGRATQPAQSPLQLSNSVLALKALLEREEEERRNIAAIRLLRGIGGVG